MSLAQMIALPAHLCTPPRELDVLDTCIRNRLIREPQRAGLINAFGSTVPQWASQRHAIQAQRLYEGHTHDNTSDGELSSREIIELAASSGIAGITIGGHNIIGDAVADARFAFERGVDCTLGYFESTLSFNKAEGHFATLYNPFDPAIPRIVANIRKDYEIEISAQISEMREMENGDIDRLLMGSYGKRFFELPPIINLGSDSIAVTKEVLQILTSGIERLKGLGQQQERILLEKALHLENLAEALSDKGIEVLENAETDEGKRQYVVFRNFILHVLAADVRIENLSQHATLDTLNKLKGRGSWTIFSHPGKREVAFGNRERVESEIRFFANKGLIQGLETHFGGYSSEMNGAYTGFYNSLHAELVQDNHGIQFYPWGGTDFHSQRDGELGIELTGCNITFGEVFDRARKYVAGNVLVEAGMILGDQGLDPGSRFWNGLGLLRNASFIDPYDLSIYQRMAALLNLGLDSQNNPI